MNLTDAPPAYVSIGSLLVGLAILVWQVLPWWWKGRKRKGKKGGKGKDEAVETGGKRDWRDLSPLALGLAFGSLAAACAGGVLGWAAHWVSRANETVGDTAVTGTTGNDEGNGVEQGVLPALNGGAAIVTTLALVALVVMWRKIPEAMRKQLGAGAWAGVSLALSAGAAGIIARAVVPGANAIGTAVLGAL